MLAYLANTLIFIMVGVVIMEKALNSLNEYDLFLLVVDYFGITVIRLVQTYLSQIVSFSLSAFKASITPPTTRSTGLFFSVFSED